ncbi:MAG: hemerythrin domain-containing protein [Sulfurovum sp.]|nr:hemerythrin domain-containing protein [Sulfurovum sp.]
MGFFSSLFKKEKRSHVPPYDRRLISKFHHEHEKLVEHIGEIQKAMELGTLGKSRVKELLKSFKMELLGHFMEEDIKLYWYLKEYYKEDQLSFSVVKEFEDSIKKFKKMLCIFLTITAWIMWSWMKSLKLYFTQLLRNYLLVLKQRRRTFIRFTSRINEKRTVAFFRVAAERSRP